MLRSGCAGGVWPLNGNLLVKAMGCFLKAPIVSPQWMTWVTATSLLMSEQSPQRQELMVFKCSEVCVFLSVAVWCKHHYPPFYHWESCVSKRWVDLPRSTSLVHGSRFQIQASLNLKVHAFPTHYYRWLSQWFSNLRVAGGIVKT